MINIIGNKINYAINYAINYDIDIIFIREREINKSKQERKLDRKRQKKDKKIFKKKVGVFLQSIKQNYIFYIALFCCIYALSKTNNNSSKLFLFISVVCMSFYGYTVHVTSHYITKFNLTERYDAYDNIYSKNKYIKWFVHEFIDFLEFHDRTHHDTDVNKTYKNIALEFINNLCGQGLALVVLKYLLNLVDNRVIILWAFLYATVHNINYNIIKPLPHQQHHINKTTNYGFDICDIILGTKYDLDNIETHNHGAINLIIITGVIIYLSKKLYTF